MAPAGTLLSRPVDEANEDGAMMRDADEDAWYGVQCTVYLLGSMGFDEADVDNIQSR
jgi:hypothetical protein